MLHHRIAFFIGEYAKSALTLLWSNECKRNEKLEADYDALYARYQLLQQDYQTLHADKVKSTLKKFVGKILNASLSEMRQIWLHYNVSALMARTKREYPLQDYNHYLKLATCDFINTNHKELTSDEIAYVEKQTGYSAANYYKTIAKERREANKQSYGWFNVLRSRWFA